MVNHEEAQSPQIREVVINNICTILNGGVYDLWKIRSRKNSGIYTSKLLMTVLTVRDTVWLHGLQVDRGRQAYNYEGQVF